MSETSLSAVGADSVASWMARILARDGLAVLEAVTTASATRPKGGGSTTVDLTELWHSDNGMVYVEGDR